MLNVDGVSSTFLDSYNAGSGGFPGLNEGAVETSADYADRPVVSTAHEILLTGLNAGETYAVTLVATDLSDGAASEVVSLTSPTRVFQADAADIAQIVEGSTSSWRTGTQMYAGRSDGNEYLGAFMFRIPQRAVDSDAIVGAAVELVSTHNWTVPYTQDPLFYVDLLSEETEGVWGMQTYELIDGAGVEARILPETSHKRGAYQRYAFTFGCGDLARLRRTLSTVSGGERRAAFTWRSTDLPGTGLLAMDTGFNRRSGGPHLRPKLILFTRDLYATAPNGASCDPATPAPTISALGIHAGSNPSSVTVSWETDVEADSLVLFREQGATDWTEVGTPVRTRIHHVQVQGLDPARRYEFAVRSAACNGAATTDANVGAGYDFFFRSDPGERREHAAYTFEAGNEGWVATNSGGSPTGWTLSLPAYESSNAWHVTPYLDETDAILTSPAVAFSGVQAAVDFRALIDTEPTYDFLHVEYSADNEATWMPIATLDARNGDFPLWSSYELRFSNPNPGGQLKIRFRFISDAYVSSPPYTGVSIDSVKFASYPNPLPPAKMPGPVPPPTAQAKGLQPPPTSLVTREDAILAGTGRCSVNTYSPFITR